MWKEVDELKLYLSYFRLLTVRQKLSCSDIYYYLLLQNQMWAEVFIRAFLSIGLSFHYYLR